MAGVEQSVKAAKSIIRNEMKKKLLGLSKETKIEQSQIVHKKLFNLPVFVKSNRISVYLSTDLEVSTKEILQKIFMEQKTCFVPRYTKDDMEMVRLNSMKDWKSLPLTKWNIKQPDFSIPRENALETGGLDLIIVPGVAFTKHGARMGHGKGYYDSYFSKLAKKQNHKAFTIGLAFKEQILDFIPTSEHDVNLDFVLYP